MTPKLFDAALLDALGAAAGASPRLRAHQVLHGSSAEPCQRMLVAIEPASYVPPHRHLDPLKAEALLVLRGVLGVVWFEDGGEVAGSAVLRAGDVAGIDIPAGLFHAVIALAPGTVFFEAKAGPWRPLQEHEHAAFAPREGETGARAYFDRLQACFADRSRPLTRRPPS